MAIDDTIAQLASELGQLEEALERNARATALVRMARDAIERVPAALEHDRYQDAVSVHQQLVLHGAAPAQVAASHEALMARLATLPPE